MRASIDMSHLRRPRTAPKVLFDEAKNHGDRPRFYLPEKVSWKQYADLIRIFGACLIDLGVKHGESVAIYAHNSLEWAVASLAIQGIGGVLVPIYPASTLKQRDYVLDHSDARFYFHKRGLSPVGADEDELSYEEIRTRGTDHLTAFEERLAALSLEDVAMMLYTSGSTGRPKGVPLTHNNIASNAVAWYHSNEPALHTDAVDLFWLPMSHIFGFGELCLGNALGFTSHVFTPQDVIEQLPIIKPTVFFSVPVYWEKLAGMASEARDPKAELERLTGGRLSFCLSGGAGLKREVKERFLEIGCLIVEGYGLSETSPTLTLNRPNDYRLDTVGRPLDNVELKLADDGEILAKGPNVFGGYYKDPEATAKAFTEDGWFCTGDLGRLTDEGFLQIVGRKKEILVTAGGKNVPPANIEIPFQDDPYIDHVVVYGDGKKYLVAGVWPNREKLEETLGEGPSEATVRKFLDQRVQSVNARLARFETIKSFAIMDQPLTVENELLTASLKIRRNKIYDHFKDTFEALYAHNACDTSSRPRS